MEDVPYLDLFLLAAGLRTALTYSNDEASCSYKKFMQVFYHRESYKNVN